MLRLRDSPWVLLFRHHSQIRIVPAMKLILRIIIFSASLFFKKLHPSTQVAGIAPREKTRQTAEQAHEFSSTWLRSGLKVR